MTNNIKEAREALGLTQDELSKKSSVARTIIAQLESGTRSNVTAETMRKLAAALECPADKLFLL